MYYNEANPYILIVHPELDVYDREQLEMMVIGGYPIVEGETSDENSWRLYPGHEVTQEEFMSSIEYILGFNSHRGWVTDGYYDPKG